MEVDSRSALSEVRNNQVSGGITTILYNAYAMIPSEATPSR